MKFRNQADSLNVPARSLRTVSRKRTRSRFLPDRRGSSESPRMDSASSTREGERSFRSRQGSGNPVRREVCGLAFRRSPSAGPPPPGSGSSGRTGSPGSGTFRWVRRGLPDGSTERGGPLRDGGCRTGRSLDSRPVFRNSCGSGLRTVKGDCRSVLLEPGDVHLEGEFERIHSEALRVEGGLFPGVRPEKDLEVRPSSGPLRRAGLPDDPERDLFRTRVRVREEEEDRLPGEYLPSGNGVWMSFCMDWIVARGNRNVIELRSH